MNRKIVLGILLVIAVLFIASNLLDSITENNDDNDGSNMFVNRIDSEQPGDDCRELIFSEDENSWIESTNSFDVTINECDEKFQECYAKTGNVYVELVQCYNDIP